MMRRIAESVRLVPVALLLLVLAVASCGPVQIGSGLGGEHALVFMPNGKRLVVSGGNRTIDVGPGRLISTVSEAAQFARDGNTVLIDPGNYAECAVWNASHLTIAARAPSVAFVGQTCQGKAIFVINGNDVTVRGITFADATVHDHNGAGIRAQGTNLTVEDSRFIDNEEGILAGANPASTIRIVGSTFRGNGTCQAACAHALYVGDIALLEVENSHFTDTHEGHDIKSRALRTVIRGTDISDGPSGHASYLVDIPNGGDLLMEHDKLSKGPHTDNNSTAVVIGEEGVSNPTHSLVIRDNSFTNLLPEQTAFVTNRTQTPAELSGNKLVGPVTPLVGPGTGTK